MTQAARAPIRTLLLLNSLCMGGAEKQVVSLFNRMGGERHEVSLLCLKEDNALLAQIDAQRISHIVPGPGVRSGFRWSAVRHLARHIDAMAIDVLVCTNMYAMLHGWLARRLCRRRRQLKLVEVFHTTDVGSRKEHFEMLLYRRLMPSTDLLIYVCHGQAEQWRAQGLQARQDMVIYNGVDTDRFVDHATAMDKAALRQAHGLSPQDYVVGLCAVMRPEKAHGDLLLALASLLREGLFIKALLIGDGPERAAIEQRIQALGLSDNVHITGLVQDVRPIIAACDVMVLSSHAVETFSIAALEAMALGKPMVMTRIGGATEQVQPGVNGLLYPAGDTAALAACLRELANPSLRDRMGVSADRLVRERFGIDRMVRSYEAALEALVAGRAVSSDPSFTATHCMPGAGQPGTVCRPQSCA